LIVQRNGILDRSGTRFNADRAFTSWKRMPTASGASKVRTVESPKPRSLPCVLAPLSRFSQRIERMFAHRQDESLLAGHADRRTDRLRTIDARSRNL
jgi:hypothetical protein